MNKRTIKMLEYEKIKETLKSYTVSDYGKNLVKKITPITEIEVIRGNIQETTEAKRILRESSSVPLHFLSGLQSCINKLGKGAELLPEELSSIKELLLTGIKLKAFMKERKIIAPCVCSYADSIYDLKDIIDEIDRCIKNGAVDDKATAELNRIRKKKAIVEDRIRLKLDDYLKSKTLRSYIQEYIVSLRDGRYVIPVKTEYKSKFKGSVLDISASGATSFIEPSDVKRLSDELNILKINESKEVSKILTYLTGLIEQYQREININIEVMAQYDFAFAKAKYSSSINGNEVSLNTRQYIKIVEGRHPLLGKNAVPLNLEIGNTYRAMVITGPNTGGKTVVLKTLGLLTLMVQSGLHVPVREGSEFAVFTDIFADIGDGQSIEQSLSTFSSHLKNIIDIIANAGSTSMVLLDELGAGTEPGEGMGLAVSILEELAEKKCVIAATTHYNEIKEFADIRAEFENASMEFDLVSLKPTYHLIMGRPGESNAFLIALKLGLREDMIERAHEITYKSKKRFDRRDYKDIIGESRGIHENTEIKDQSQKVGEKDIMVNETTIVPKERGISQNEREKLKKKFKKQKEQKLFCIGDSVHISSLSAIGIVCELENKNGEVGVMVKKKKIKVNKKRLELYIKAEELYPDDYDMDIVFENKEIRKKRHLLARKHVEGLTIEHNIDKQY